MGWARPFPAASTTGIPSSADCSQPLSVVDEPLWAVIRPATGLPRSSIKQLQGAHIVDRQHLPVGGRPVSR